MFSKITLPIFDVARKKTELVIKLSPQPGVFSDPFEFNQQVIFDAAFTVIDPIYQKPFEITTASGYYEIVANSEPTDKEFHPIAYIVCETLRDDLCSLNIPYFHTKEFYDEPFKTIKLEIIHDINNVNKKTGIGPQTLLNKNINKFFFKLNC